VREKRVRKKRPTEKSEDKLTGEDRQLLKEVGKNGRGRPNEVEHILNEGANPNAKSKDGVSALHSALRNRHYDCIPILIRAGADKDAKCPPYAVFLFFKWARNFK
jgi:ankyrin repeat protein